MATDIERLNAVIEGKISGRGCGKTFARVHELASTIELGTLKNCVVVISEYRDMSYIVPMIQEVFKERGLPKLKKVKENRGRCGDVLVDFVAQRDYADYMRGRDNLFEIPMGHWD